MHWRAVNFKMAMEVSCLDSYASTITRLRNRQLECLDSSAATVTRLRNRGLEGGKKVMFLRRSLVRSRCRIIEVYEGGLRGFIVIC